jgi:hypothetical protein
MSKYIVPEGMLKAAVRVGPHGCESEIKRIIEAALLWLSENPIVPTPDQMDGCCDDIKGAKSLMMNVHEIAIHCSVEWQRRMFVAPEPETTMLGRSKDEWIQHIETLFSIASKGDDIPQNALLYAWKGTVTNEDKKWAYSTIPPEPEAPEAIKDLWDASPTPDTKRRTIEAYRRGKESCKQ